MGYPYQRSSRGKFGRGQNGKLPVYYPSSCCSAIKPHIRLFNTVKSMYPRDSRINTGHKFAEMCLGRRWDYINMARDCIGDKGLLRKCNIVPMFEHNRCETGYPFWFKIQHTRSDNYKHTEEEICRDFWIKFLKTGSSLYVLNMTFEEITININEIIRRETRFLKKTVVSVGDVVIGLRDEFERREKRSLKNKEDCIIKYRPYVSKNDGWFGRICYTDFKKGYFEKTNSLISRPRYYKK